MKHSTNIKYASFRAAIFAVLLVLSSGMTLAEDTGDITLSGKNIRNVVVSLENSRHAWPYQRGTTQADVLYEIVAEGHITRILSLFRNIKEVDAEIGPVRSVRNYFMPFITDIDALLLFCGASPSGYGRLERETSITGLDEIANSDIFHRTKGIAPPHNLFTDRKHIETGIAGRKMNLIPSNELVTGSKEPVTRASEMWPSPEEGMNASKADSVTPDQLEQNLNKVRNIGISETDQNRKNISIRYTSTYCVTYKYDEKTCLYYRYINGEPHIDHNCRTQLSPATVVIAVIDAKIMDEKGRLDIDVPSELPATIYSKGQIIKGTWSQPGGNSPLPLCDENDFPFFPPQGQTIFHLVTPMVTVNMVTETQFAKEETSVEKFKRLWNGLLSGASVRTSTLAAISKLNEELTAEEAVEIEKHLAGFKDNLKVRVLLVSSLLAEEENVRKFVASLLTNYYKADGYEYVKSDILEEKLLSNDQYVRNRALTELVDNLEVSGIN